MTDPQIDEEDVTFGPSALATPANALTILRILLAPVAFGLVVAQPSSWITYVFWMVLASSDGLDGYLARRYGTTRSGAFLDPLADKVLMLGGLCALASIQRFFWVPVGIIAVREIVISLYRSYWGRQGIAVPAIAIAKAKTTLQAAAIALAVFPPFKEVYWPADIVLWISVGLALVSGWMYLSTGRRLHTRAGTR